MRVIKKKKKTTTECVYLWNIGAMRLLVTPGSDLPADPLHSRLDRLLHQASHLLLRPLQIHLPIREATI